MSDPFVLLKKDHREAEALLKTLAASNKPGPRRRAALGKLNGALTLHMQIEERLIYPLVPRLLGHEAAKEAAIEHKLARTGLSELIKLADQPGFGAAVAMLNAGIKHHVKEEETELFPKMKRGLDRRAITELGEAVMTAKTSPQAKTNRTKRTSAGSRSSR